MYDLHCHMLPGIDDGAPTREIALEMARMAVADGIQVTACTPHIYPGLYENTAPGIAAAIAALRADLEAEGIPLQLVMGADVHLDPALVAGLKEGRIPTLNGSRYFLFEPPHHVAPPRLEDELFRVMTAGYVPVLTHPERLSWIDSHYPLFTELVKRGVWMQLTAASVTGKFGKAAAYWAHKFLDDGLVHIIASDAHHSRKRPPILSEAREWVAARYGREEAEAMVSTRPRGILDNQPPESLRALPSPEAVPRLGYWRRLFG